jgi:hypothetical protein
MNYIDIISSVGVFLILLAFFLNTFNYIEANSKLYLLLNIVGGAFACYGSILLNSLPFIILEGTWSLVALIGLFKCLRS